MHSFSISATKKSCPADRRKEEAPIEPQDAPGLLTHSTLLLTQALSTAHAAPDIREEKVAAIKARLAAGAYEIDSFRLAESLVNENPGLFRRF